MPKPRSRTLSLEGQELFNLALDNNSNQVQHRVCLKAMLYNLFTSDFDEKLDKSKFTFRDGTYSLYSYLKDEDPKKIPDFFNNAVTNLVYLILITDGKVNNIRNVKKNVYFYYCLAEEAFKLGDHNTVILIKAALDNIAIRRLKLKKTKKEKRLDKLFSDSYGSFINCNSNHLKAILEAKDYQKFLPSIVVLLMHLNKTKEYAKCYEKLGKFPKDLQEKHDELQGVVDSLYEKYKGFKQTLLELYKKNPSQNMYFENKDMKTMSVKLFELSCKIKN